MKNITMLILALMILPGCAFNVAWRGTLTYVEQKATTDGKVESKPVARDTSIAAEKTTDAKLDLPIK
jgi:hypothetical protein